MAANEEQFFVENEVPELSTPFVMVYGPEITDSRLSWAEKGLLWWLRFRCCSKRGTWVSWKTVADDFGESESNVRKKASKLKELGWIKCESRGMGKSKVKVLSRPSAHYSEELFSPSFFNYLKGDRTEQQIAELRSIDNAEQDPLRLNLSGGTAQKVASGALKNERSEVDKGEEEKSEKDPTAYGSRGEPPSGAPRRGGIGFSGGDPYDLETGEVLSQEDYHPGALGPDLEEKGEAAPAPDDRLSQAWAVTVSAGARASEKSREAKERREARKAERDASGETERRERLKRMTKEERQTIGSKIHEFCREVFYDNFQNVRWGNWRAQQYSQVKALLEDYDGDADLVKRGWTYLCEHWDDVRKELKIEPSLPTIGFLWAFKDRIFSKIQEYETERQSLEKQKLTGKFEW